MKWKNKGHEFDKEYQELDQHYQGKSIVLYGAGLMGCRVYDAIESLTDIKIVEFWDRDRSKDFCKGVPVKHWEDNDSAECTIDSDESIIVICLPDEIGAKVRDSIILSLGLRIDSIKLYSEFIMHDFPIICLYKYNKVFLDTLSLIVTEKCTLKCKDCAIMLPYFKEVRGFSVDELIKETHVVFDKVDFLGNYTLTGGEPLLNKDLGHLLKEIGEKYRNRIGSFKIITNGTILPSKELLDIMKAYSVTVDISDYTKGFPQISGKIKEVVETFYNSGVDTYYLQSDKWVDFGFGTVNNDFTDEEAIKYFDYCRTRCRGYVKGKVIYCINAYYAQRTLYQTDDKSNEYNLLNNDFDDKSKKELVEFDLGYSDKGFLDMCQSCNGTIDKNDNFIIGGIQCQES